MDIKDEFSFSLDAMDLNSAILMTDAMKMSGKIPPIAITMLLRCALELTLMAPPGHFRKVYGLWESAMKPLLRRLESVDSMMPDETDDVPPQ